MDSGLYTAYSGLKTNSDILELLSNNLANVNTTGFKGDQAFLRIYNHAVDGDGISLNRVLNDSTFVEGSNINLLPGTIKNTGRDLDVALQGSGFFVVQSPAGDRFTRNGNFQLDGAGQLTNSDGMPVLGQNGPIQLPPGQVVITPTGEVQVNGSTVDTLRLVDFVDSNVLEKVGNSLFRLRDEQSAPAAAPVNTVVVQNSLEESNVNPIREMMLMISTMRQFESLQKALYTLMNTVNDRAINQVGRIVG
jgi:flagellar basal-body rod protein FlgG